MVILPSDIIKKYESLPENEKKLFLTYETAQSMINDFITLQKVEALVFNTESPDLIEYYLNDLGLEVLDTQSAIDNKGSILKVLGGLKDRLKQTWKEYSNEITGSFRINAKMNYEDLEIILKDLKEGKYEVNDKIVNGSKLENKFGVFHSLGYNINNKSDIIKAFNFAPNVGIKLLSENTTIFKKWLPEFFPEKKDIPVSTSGINFIKSLKIENLKDIDFVTSFPTMLYTNNVPILSLGWKDTSLNLNTDVIKVDNVSLNNVYSIQDMISIIEEAIKILKELDKTNKEILKISSEFLYYAVPDLRYFDRDENRLARAKSTIVGMISKFTRYSENLATFAKHLAYNGNDVSKFTNDLIKACLIKK